MNCAREACIIDLERVERCAGPNTSPQAAPEMGRREALDRSAFAPLLEKASGTPADRTVLRRFGSCTRIDALPCPAERSEPALNPFLRLAQERPGGIHRN